MRLFLMMILTATAVLAQYAAIQGTDYPANSLGILNAKPTLRTGTVAPTGNCTAGLDMYVDTVARELYFCGSLNVWTKSGSVASVFGRSGAVTATSGDYTAAQVTNAVDSTATYANPSWLTSLPWSKITSPPTLTNTVFGRSGAVVATSGDYTAAQVTNAIDATQTYSDPGFISAMSATKLTSGFIPLARIGQNGATNGQALAWNGAAWAPATISGAGGYTTVQDNGTGVTQRTTLNFLPTADISCTPSDLSSKTAIQCLIDAGKWPTRNQVVLAADRYLTSTGTSTAYVATSSFTGLSGYASGQEFNWLVHIASGTSPVINVNSLGNRKLYMQDGTTQITSGQLAASSIARIVYDATLDAGAGGFRVTNLSGSGGAPVATRGAFASLPSCTTAGQVYLFTDSRYASAHCDGSTWQYVLPHGRLVSLPPALTLGGNTGSTGQSTTTGGIYFTWANSATGLAYLSETVAGSFTRTIYVEPVWFSSETNTSFSIQITDGTNIQELYFGNDSGSTKVMVRCGNGGYAVQKTYPVAGLGANLIGKQVWLRAASDGTNFTFDIGDGASWFTVNTGAKSTCSVGTVSAIRMAAYNNTGGATYAKHWIGAWQ